MNKLKVKKLHPAAIVPKYATLGAACFDLHALIVPDEGYDASELDEADRLIVEACSAAHIRTGLSFEVPPGWVMKVYSRSGHGFKNATRLVNCVGVIDSDYRGEVMVGLKNDGGADLRLRHGDRIAQAMLVPAEQWELEEVEDLSETERGAGGFGSTGR